MDTKAKIGVDFGIVKIENSFSAQKIQGCYMAEFLNYPPPKHAFRSDTARESGSPHPKRIRIPGAKATTFKNPAPQENQDIRRFFFLTPHLKRIKNAMHNGFCAWDPDSLGVRGF